VNVRLSATGPDRLPDIVKVPISEPLRVPVGIPSRLISSAGKVAPPSALAAVSYVKPSTSL
jgi:hypothetical protein